MLVCKLNTNTQRFSLNGSLCLELPKLLSLPKQKRLQGMTCMSVVTSGPAWLCWSGGCFGETSAVVLSMWSCLLAPWCSQQGLHLKPKIYFCSAVDRAVLPGRQLLTSQQVSQESGLQARQWPGDAVCCDTVSSKSPFLFPAVLPGTISPSPAQNTRKPILFLDPWRSDGSIQPHYTTLLMKLLSAINFQQYLLWYLEKDVLAIITLLSSFCISHTLTCAGHHCQGKNCILALIQKGTMSLCGSQVPTLKWAVKFSLGVLDIQEQLHRWWELGLDIWSSAQQHYGLGVDWTWWWWIGLADRLEGWLPVMRWAEVSQVCGWLVSKAHLHLNLFFLWKGCFIQHQQKSCWIFAQGGNGLDLAAVGIIKVCITKASSRQSDFFHGAILQFSDYVNIHGFFSRQQIIAPGGSVQLYHFCRLS